MEHDAKSSRRYKENWEDEVQAGKADRAEIAELKEAYALLFKESGERRDEIERLRALVCRLHEEAMRAGDALCDMGAMAEARMIRDAYVGIERLRISPLE